MSRAFKLTIEDAGEKPDPCISAMLLLMERAMESDMQEQDEIRSGIREAPELKLSTTEDAQESS